MKKILTILISLALCIGVGASFVGCNREVKIDDEGNIYLDFWTVYPTGDPGNAWIEGLIEEYEADHPNVHITHSGTSFWDYFLTALPPAMTDEHGPDVFMNTTTDNAARAEGLTVYDISDFIAADDTLDPQVDFNASERDALTSTVNGEEGIFGVPWQTDGRMLYYNANYVNDMATAVAADPTLWTSTTAYDLDLVGEAPTDLFPADRSAANGTGGYYDWTGDNQLDARGPKTFGEMLAYAELLTVYEGGDKKKGDITRLGFNFDVGNNSILNFLYNMVDEDGNPGRVFDAEGNAILYESDDDYNTVMARAYELWYEFENLNGRRDDMNAFVSGATPDGGSAVNLFYNGSAAMMINTNEIPWRNEDLLEDTTVEGGVNLGVCAIPYSELQEENKAEQRANFSGGYSLEISNVLLNYDERVAQAAYDFVSFLMSEEVQMQIPDAVTNMPGRAGVYNSLQESAEENKEYDKMMVFQEMVYRRPMDFFPDSVNWINDVADKNLTDYEAGPKNDRATTIALLRKVQADIEQRQSIA